MNTGKDISTERELLSRLFAIRADKRTFDNYVKVLKAFDKKKQATPMQILKKTGISASTLYEQIIKSLKPIYLRKVRDIPSKRGPTESNPVYELTQHGILLLGFLARKKGLIIEAIDADSENPFYELVSTVFADAPEELLFDAAFEALYRRDMYVEAFFTILSDRNRSRPYPTEIMDILDLVGDAYSRLPRWKQDMVLDYFIGKMREHYLMNLHGSELKKYYEETKLHPHHIVYLCTKCRLVMKTDSPFETSILCDKCRKQRDRSLRRPSLNKSIEKPA